MGIIPNPSGIGLGSPNLLYLLLERFCPAGAAGGGRCGGGPGDATRISSGSSVDVRSVTKEKNCGFGGGVGGQS